MYLKKNPNKTIKTCRTLIEKQEQTHDRFSMDTYTWTF